MTVALLIVAWVLLVIGWVMLSTAWKQLVALKRARKVIEEQQEEIDRLHRILSGEPG